MDVHAIEGLPEKNVCNAVVLCPILFRDIDSGKIFGSSPSAGATLSRNFRAIATGVSPLGWLSAPSGLIRWRGNSSG